LAAQQHPGQSGGSGALPGSDLPRPSSVDLDHYQLLGVPYTARKADITRAYREAMKAIHPDRQRPERRTAAEEQAKRVNAAYAVLVNPVQRQAYDRTIRSAHVQDQLMSRYVGGFYPAAGGDADLFGAPMRRRQTTAERREQAAADRNAVMTIVVVFGGFTLALLVGLVLWGVLTSLLRAAI
jgi:DnaJ-class molecular chaperone